VLCHYLVRRWLEKPGTRPGAAFAAGFLAILLSSLLTAAALALSDEGFLAAAQTVIAANVPVMVIEGFITAFIVGFIAKVQPEILQLRSAS